MIRRGVAFLVLCLLAIVQVERILPDICDGDATATEVAAFSGATSDMPHRAALLSQASVSSAPSSNDKSAPASPHETHSCHCAHVHGGAPAQSTDRPPALAVDASGVSATRDLAPAGVTIEPRLRPPLG